MSCNNFKSIKQRIKDLCIGNVSSETSTENNDVQKEILKTNVEHIKLHSNIPTRYLDSKIKAATAEQESLIKTFRANFNSKKFKDMKDILIYGSVGTGKTYLTTALLNKMISVNVYCRYVTEHYLLDLYNQKKYDTFDAFKKVNILVIDEIGKRQLVDWQMIHLEELISYRYNEMLPTIFITNLNQKEFKEFVGDRVVSRLRENKVISVVMEGEDLRGKKL